MTIPEYLKKVRTEAGISQKELAQKIGIKQSTYSQYETGRRRPKLDTLGKIMSALPPTSTWDTSKITDNTSLFVQTRDFQDLFRLQDDIKHRRAVIINSLLESLKKEVLFNDSNDIFTDIPEEELLYYFWKLNSEGQSVALQRIIELSEIPRYQTPASQEEGIQ